MNILHALLTLSLYFHSLAAAASPNQPRAAPFEQDEAVEGSIQKRYQHHDGIQPAELSLGRQDPAAQRVPQELPTHQRTQGSNGSSSTFQNPGSPQIRGVGNDTWPETDTSGGDSSDDPVSEQSSVDTHDSAHMNELLPTFVLYDYNSEPCSRRPIVQCSYILPVSNVFSTSQI